MKQWLIGAPLVTQTQGGIRWLQLGLECNACGSRDQQEQIGMHLSLSYRSWPRTAALTAVVGHAGSQEAVGSGLHSPSVAVAAAVDAMQMEEIVGSIAGDDTIMAAVRTTEDVQTVMDKISEIIK